MKKMICALLAVALMLCSFALAETIAPQFTEIDAADGTYPVTFDRKDLKDGVLNNVVLSTEDVYDIVDVSRMAVGDTFEAEGKSVTIETIENDEYGHILINGGSDVENGYTLTSHEDENGWTTLLDDDYCTYTERGAFNLELAGNVTFTDSWDIDSEPVTATGIEEVTRAISESPNDAFIDLNTTIRIEGGKIVEIIRDYMP